MRQIKDMQASLATSIFAGTGLLLIAYGLSAFGYSRHFGMLGVALVGGISLAIAVFLRKPSQLASYREFLKRQEQRDLVEAKGKHWMDEESREAIETELKARESQS